MNFPAIARKTYDALRSQPAFSNITQFVLDHLKKIKSPLERARFVHNVVDDYNREIFSHPIVKEFLPCKKGCAGCCHTQVSVTEDEAELLASRINEGLKIDFKLLQNQMKAVNDNEAYFNMSYEDRKCVFLGTDNQCQVYSDRPSVCRTNAVLGEASQCSTFNGLDNNQTLRLVKTEKADMAIIGSYLSSKESGTLSHMLGKILTRNKSLPTQEVQKSTKKKPIFKDWEL